MSRLGKKPVAVPAGVNVSVSGRTLTVSSGKQTLKLEHRPEVKVAWKSDDRTISVSVDPVEAEDASVLAFWGTTRSHIQNMIVGVTQGYEKNLEVVGVGYTAAVSGRNLDLKLGFANPIRVQIPEGVEVAIEKQFIKIRGADKQKVGQLAAEVRALRKPEPYNGKGVKYTTEVIKKKQGKAFGA